MGGLIAWLEDWCVLQWGFEIWLISSPGLHLGDGVEEGEWSGVVCYSMYGEFSILPAVQ